MDERTAEQALSACYGWFRLRRNIRVKCVWIYLGPLHKQNHCLFLLSAELDRYRSLLIVRDHILIQHGIWCCYDIHLGDSRRCVSVLGNKLNHSSVFAAFSFLSLAILSVADSLGFLCFRIRANFALCSLLQKSP